MSEDQGEYVTKEDVGEAMEMLGKGYLEVNEPSFIIEPKSTVLIRVGKEVHATERDSFVKISTSFKDELEFIDGNSLKVWIFISLSINRNSGMAFPGLRTIAKKTKLSVNTVQKCISDLEEQGLMTIHKGKRKTNLYEPTAYVSANKKDAVSKTDTDEEAVSNSSQTVSKKIATVSPRVIHNQRNQRNQKSSAPEKTYKKQKPDLLDGILHYEKIGEEKEREGKSWTHRDKFPEPFLENLDAYVSLTGQKPIKKNVSDWLMTAQDWHDLGVKPADIQKAYEKANPESGEGFTVARPGSLTSTAGMFAGKRKVEVKQSKPKIYKREAKKSVPNPLRR